MIQLRMIALFALLSLTASSAVAAEFHSDPVRGISFKAPGGSWRMMELGRGIIAESSAGSSPRMRIVWLLGDGGGLVNALEARVASLWEGTRVQRPKLLKLGREDAFAMRFERDSTSPIAGSAIAIPFGKLAVGVICAGDRETEISTFLSCRRLAAGIEVKDPARAAAVANYEAGMERLAADPAGATRSFEKSIASDRSLSLAYPSLARAMLMRGDSVEMVEARLGALLGRAPASAGIEGMMTRLKGLSAAPR